MIKKKVGERLICIFIVFFLGVLMAFRSIVFSDNHFVYLEEWRQLSNEFIKNQNCLTYGCWILNLTINQRLNLKVRFFKERKVSRD